ncbi:UBX domain protein Ubx2 [Mycoemilia scoparia]|uniref:UBX domain protein Ubx2 n=1 Tax=Mycoemilia scoparia TaxID=417184 RepID=A0A9W8DTN0_9FUNG|nr:UBX domain protein Ubx2 [Mycoemilia scoparia]
MADSDSLDEKISRFISITNADHEKALQYINFVGDFERAVSMYFEKDGAPIIEDDIPTTGAGNAGTSAGMLDDEVRAPIAARRERLVDTNIFGERYYSGFVSGVNNQPNDPFVDANNDSWSRLFALPHGLVFNGSLDLAQLKAEEEDRWIMIHFHDPEEFTSMQINRDFWNDEKIIELINSRIVFLQWKKDSNECQSYAHSYHINMYPTIILVDPVTVEECLDELHDNPQPRKKERGVEGLTEEEQLSLAIAASMKEAGVEEDSNLISIEDSSDADSAKHPATKGKNREQILISDDDENDQNGQKKPVSGGDDIISSPIQSNPVDPDLQTYLDLPESYNEPPIGPDVTRVKFQLPDGKSVILRIRKTDKVANLFSAVKSQFPDIKDGVPKLFSNNVGLWEKRDETIQDVGIANSVIRISLPA